MMKAIEYLASHLTTSGWVVFTLMIASWLALIVSVIRPSLSSSDVAGWRPLAVAVWTVWFVYLVTP